MVATPPDSGNARQGIMATPATLGAALQLVYATLQQAPLWFGHGTDSAWDEAVMLVLLAADQRPDADDSVLDLPMTESAWKRAQGWLRARIEERTPLPYLTGQAWFAGLPFRCDPRALVPRSPLAEVIGDDYAPWWSGPAPERLLDLCCGGGCIGIAAAVHRPDLSVLLADIDSAALELAAENIALHRVSGRVATRRSDLLGALQGERFDIILCNPPYVDADDLQSMPAEYLAEPARGLGAGADGLLMALKVLRSAAAHLNERGVLFLELGNSWQALDTQLAAYPLTWLEFAQGGQGVLVLRRDELLELATFLP